LDEQIDTKQCIPSFGLGLRGFPKKEISCIEEEDLSPLFFHLGDQGGLLGDPAKRISESPAGLNLAHHIIGINDAEMDFRCSEKRRGVNEILNTDGNEEDRKNFPFHYGGSSFEA